jgi:YD repeat-containing protein
MTSGDENVSVSYTWDSLNRLSTVVDSKLGTTAYTYDAGDKILAFVLRSLIEMHKFSFRIRSAFDIDRGGFVRIMAVLDSL